MALANLTEVCMFVWVASDYEHVTFVITDSNEIYTTSAGERAFAWWHNAARRYSFIQTSHKIVISAYLESTSFSQKVVLDVMLLL